MTDHNDDFVSFENALHELNLQDDELKKLVSEGEIRAFRDGTSMKFKREDIESIRPQDDAGEELVFADALEDDTGMVTEELSDEDTLLADDDLLDDPDEPDPVAAPPVTRRASRGAKREEEEVAEPVWGSVMTVIACLLLAYASLAVWAIGAESSPAGLLGMFASK